MIAVMGQNPPIRRFRIGQIDAKDSSWTFTLFLNATATEVLACTGVARSASPTGRDSEAT
ncbi:hypothetical protein ACIBSV_37675 [Embleya sp. NPDC050154]|uniref:hypothetical protein n=1 Tax=unclassified Embleya TaxID=2699296 RepID=UPI00379AC1F7